MRKLVLAAVWMIVMSVGAQTTKSVTVTSPGTLHSFFTTTELTQITTLTVSGSIDARDFAFLRDKVKMLGALNMGGASIKAYSGTEGTNSGIATSYPANGIPDYAFYNPQLLTYKSGLTTITLPSTTASIGELAFYFAWNLTGINIPASVSYIADFAFYGCYALTSVSVATANKRYSSTSGVLLNEAKDTLFLFPNSKTGNYALPSTVKHVYKSAFENSFMVSSIVLPSTLQSIGTNAFAYCSGIGPNLTLPSSLKKLEDGAFYGCYNLTGTVSLPANLTDLGSYCFLESNNINAFYVDASNPYYSSWNDVLYSKDLDTIFICPPAKAGNYTIPSNVKVIGSYAFYNCKQLTGSFNIPAATDYIGYYAFFGCPGIESYQADTSNPYFSAEDGILYSKNKDRLLICPTSKSGPLSLPSTLQYIDPGAFNSCTAITGTVHLPSTMTWMGDYSFYNCSGISGFSVDSENNYYSAVDGVLFNKNTDSVYICPVSKSGSYSLPTTVRHIGYSAFEGCTQLTEVIFPSTLESIGSSAFGYCSGLTNIEIPESTHQFGYGTFYSCSNLQEFAIRCTTPPVVDYYFFEGVNKTTTQLAVPVGSKTGYGQAPYWSDFSDISERDFSTGLSTETSNEDYSLLPYKGGLKIGGLETGDRVQIYSIDGKLLRDVHSNAFEMYLPFPLRGIFIVKINRFSRKIRL